MRNKFYKDKKIQDRAMWDPTKQLEGSLL